jgi:peroxiredoxin
MLPFIGAAQNGMYDVCPLKVGESIPEGISLQSKEGKAIELKSVLAEKPTVLIFYRGGWCPYCTKHLAEIQEAKSEIEALGYQIIAITPDQPQRLEKSVERSKTEYPIYSDSELDAINAFGLGWQVDKKLFAKYKDKYQLDLTEWSGKEHNMLPVPGLYIIKDNVVEFNYVNPKYSTRLKAETLLAILETLD